MGKKASKKAAEETDKVPFQVRFDRDLHGQLSRIAEASEISVNQLVQGICRGAMSHVQVGAWDEYGMLEGQKPTLFVVTRPAKGCVWFGKEGEFSKQLGEPTDRGAFWFGIDVRERGDVHFASRPPA